jgi:hypothetical protein
MRVTFALIVVGLAIILTVLLSQLFSIVIESLR